MAAGRSGGTGPTCRSLAEGRRAMSTIDAHVHVWTDDVERYPRATQTGVKPSDFPAEELLRHCRPSGVERIVLVQVSFYGFDNSYMLDTMQRLPETFSGIALVD